MKITLVNCPYCNLNQKIFHISYSLKKFLNNFEKLEVFILGKFNKNQEIIKKFNCGKCSMTLLIYYDIEKSKYFINGERLEELRNSSTNTKKDIKILKQKSVENDNEQVKEYLKINIIKEEEKLNHLIQREKELTKNVAKEGM
jgi:hypothetical protein